jgi:hypothetical protein
VERLLPRHVFHNNPVDFSLCMACASGPTVFRIGLRFPKSLALLLPYLVATCAEPWGSFST